MEVPGWCPVGIAEGDGAGRRRGTAPARPGGNSPHERGDCGPSPGYTTIGLPIERCTSRSNGVLVHEKDYNNPTSLGTRYDKTGGSTVSVRLGYSMSGSTTYSSCFDTSSGGSVTKSWQKSGSYMCYNSTGVLNYCGGTFQRPPRTAETSSTEAPLLAAGPSCCPLP